VQIQKDLETGRQELILAAAKKASQELIEILRKSHLDQERLSDVRVDFTARHVVYSGIPLPEAGGWELQKSEQSHPPIAMP
jgi:hypothetical protein